MRVKLVRVVFISQSITVLNRLQASWEHVLESIGFHLGDELFIVLE